MLGKIQRRYVRTWKVASSILRVWQRRQLRFLVVSRVLRHQTVDSRWTCAPHPPPPRGLIPLDCEGEKIRPASSPSLAFRCFAFPGSRYSLSSAPGERKRWLMWKRRRDGVLWGLSRGGSVYESKLGGRGVRVRSAGRLRYNEQLINLMQLERLPQNLWPTLAAHDARSALHWFAYPLLPSNSRA